MAVDDLIVRFDHALRTLAGAAHSARPIPGGTMPEGELSRHERRHAGALMRVNHCGEVCAQALYQGEALAARNPLIADALSDAAAEESEHLAWTEERIRALGSRKSLLNPAWYCASLGIGVLAGRLGDAWNLGFLAETERQVEAHLASHLRLLPLADRKSRAVLDQMKSDESKHAATATRLGGQELPYLARLAMRFASGVMTRIAYWV